MGGALCSRGCYVKVRMLNVSGWGILAADAHCLPESPCTGFTLDRVLAEGTSEVVNDYICENVHGQARDCGRYPRVCPGLNGTGARLPAVRPALPRNYAAAAGVF